MICPSCHTPNRDDAKFCKGCGQPLQAEPARSANEAVMANAVPASPASATSAQGSAESAPVQAEPEHPPEAPVTNNAEDISTAPTLILTPEKMMALHNRRWQEEAEKEQQGTGTSSSPQQAASSPAAGTQDQPTMPAVQDEQSQQDVAEMPTVLMNSPASNPVAADEPVPAPPPPPSSLPTAQAATSPAPAETGATETTDQSVGAGEDAGRAPAVPSVTNGTTETGKTGETTTTTEKSAEPMQASSDQPGADQVTSTDDFPVLSIGTTVAERYEITQVVSDSPQEHVYSVTDHQGYQHCWNCGSEQNAEGDEFCIDCGASLLNVPYLMHEYPAASANNEGESAASGAAGTEDANVLQGNIANTFVNEGHTYVIEQPQVEQNTFPNGVRLLAACDSDAGNVRRSEPNEDSTLVLLLQRVFESTGTPEGVFIVADGLGGHDSGQVASRTTINIISERMVRELLAAPLSAEKNGEAVRPFDEDARIALFHGSIEDANTALCQKNQLDKTDMGSTITGFMIVGDHAYIINVGDSRTYMLRGQQLYQLTTDHSLVGQLVASGMIEPDDVYTHPQRSQIFRSLGDKPNVQIDMFKQKLHPGDILLSCSDGLWEMVRNPQIESILNNAPDPQTACTQLIETANINGGEDNISAVVVFVR
ncbi:MAG TPA: zinc-ribbon domain-containing protein [Ktedonobacteraceae bacterium]